MCFSILLDYELMCIQTIMKEVRDRRQVRNKIWTLIMMMYIPFEPNINSLYTFDNLEALLV